MALILVVSIYHLLVLVFNIYPYGNLNILTPLLIPDVSARGQYMQNLILHVLCMATHKRLSDF